MRQVKFILRARDAHVKQPPFLFETLRHLRCPLVREHVLREPDDKHSRPLQPFRLMYCRKGHPVILGCSSGIRRLRCSQQRHLRKKFLRLLELRSKGFECHEIIPARFIVRILLPQHLIINREESDLEHFGRAWCRTGCRA